MIFQPSPCEEEPIHIINVAIKIDKKNKDPALLNEQVYEFTKSQVSYDESIMTRVTYGEISCRFSLKLVSLNQQF